MFWYCNIDRLWLGRTFSDPDLAWSQACRMWEVLSCTTFLDAYVLTLITSNWSNENLLFLKWEKQTHKNPLKTKVLTSVSYRPPCQEDEAYAQQFDHLTGINRTGSPSDDEVHTDHIPLAPASVASPDKKKQCFRYFSLIKKKFTSKVCHVPEIKSLPKV